jgi:hypothetical protein
LYWKRIVLDNWSPCQVFQDIFRGDTACITLKRLYDLKTMFMSDTLKTARYLGACYTRGNPGFDSYAVIDMIMAELIERYPLSTMSFYRAEVANIRGLATGSYTEAQLLLSLRRCQLTRKQNTFFSARQDALRIERFMLRMRDVGTDIRVRLKSFGLTPVGGATG